MPELDPVYYDATDKVVERKSEHADWDPDEMHSAILEVLKGAGQQEAVEDRDFSQAALSRAVSEVEEVADDLREQSRGGSKLFRDPVEEAVDEFESFFEEMNERYDMGIRETAIQMMVDEIRDARQLPSPMYLGRFLKGAKSGVSGADVDYIKRRYESKLDDFTTGESDQSVAVSGMQSSGGARIGGGQQNVPNMENGIPIGGENENQRRAVRSNGMQGGGGRNPEVERLEREIEEIKNAVVGGSSSSGEAATIQVEKEDGEVVTMPADHPAARELVSQGNQQNQMLQTLQQAKELGLIPDPNQQQQAPSEGEKLAEEIGNAIESMGERQMQAQQKMSQSFSQAISEIKELVADDDDDDFSADDVREIINEELKDDEIDRLEQQLEKMRSEFSNELRNAKKSNSSVMDDPELFKTDREMELREQQLQTMNENLQELPTRTAAAIQKGVIPLVERLNDSPGGNPLWTPPQPPQGQQQGAQPQQQRGHQPRDAGQSSRPAQQQSPPTSGRGGQEEVQSRGEPNEQSDLRAEDDSMTQESDGDDLGEYGDQVRDKLNIGDEADSSEVEA